MTIETLKFPLFHGTSSIFARSILTGGLGARNVVREMNAVEFLSRACALGREHLDLESDRKLADHVFMSDSMIEQRFTPGRMNFRHGDVYLTPSITQAAQYATLNPAGSEIISRCAYVYQKLEEWDRTKGTQLTRELNRISPGISALRPQEAFPVLMEIRGVSKELFAGESDQNVDDEISFIEKNLNESSAVFEIITSQSNFRLIRPPIAPSLIRAYRFSFDISSRQLSEKREWELERE